MRKRAKFVFYLPLFLPFCLSLFARLFARLPACLSSFLSFFLSCVPEQRSPSPISSPSSRSGSPANPHRPVALAAGENAIRQLYRVTRAIYASRRFITGCRSSASMLHRLIANQRGIARSIVFAFVVAAVFARTIDRSINKRRTRAKISGDEERARATANRTQA